MIFQHPKKRGKKEKRKTLSLDLCYACFGLVMGPYKPKTCTTRPQIVSGHHQTHLGWEIGQSGKEEAGPM